MRMLPGREVFLACIFVLSGPHLAAVKSHKLFSSRKAGEGGGRLGRNMQWFMARRWGMLFIFFPPFPNSFIRCELSTRLLDDVLEGERVGCRSTKKKKLWVSNLALPCDFCLAQVRSRTSAPGRDASGASPAPMSWRGTSGSTPGWSPSSAACAAAVSPALTTWPCTPRDTRAKGPLSCICPVF